MTFDGATFDGATFDGATFDGATFDGGTLDGGTLDATGSRCAWHVRLSRSSSGAEDGVAVGDAEVLWRGVSSREREEGVGRLGRGWEVSSQLSSEGVTTVDTELHGGAARGDRRRDLEFLSQSSSESAITEEKHGRVLR